MAKAYGARLRPRQNIYNRAMKDFISPPIVRDIGTDCYNGAVGDRITICAVDDFLVANVRVEIYTAGGQLIESGDARSALDRIHWAYTVTQVNSVLAGSRIKATAFDVPGNKASLEIILQRDSNETFRKKFFGIIPNPVIIFKSDFLPDGSLLHRQVGEEERDQMRRMRHRIWKSFYRAIRFVSTG